jgi:soluble P-type ATPase
MNQEINLFESISELKQQLNEIKVQITLATGEDKTFLLRESVLIQERLLNYENQVFGHEQHYAT